MTRMGLNRRRAVAAMLAMVSPARIAWAQTASEEMAALIGHWRKTTIEFESPKDDNLVFKADGTMENWTATASGRSEAVAGTWRAEGGMLMLQMPESEEASLPYTFFEGKLVLPNIPDQRGFWDRIE